jgi:hypothetical protein
MINLKYKIGLLFVSLVFLSIFGRSQEVSFFSEGTGPTFYDQGIVDKNNLGESIFEYTFPPSAPQYNDKVPCSTVAYKGSTSLEFNYTSAENGNWKTTIFRNDWSSADISGLDSLSFYIYSENELPNTALPLIGLRAANKSGSGDVNSKYYPLADYNATIPAAQWTQVKFPLRVIFDHTENSELNFSEAKGVIFSQSENNNTARLILIDEITAFKSLDEIPTVEALTATGYDSHAELNWSQPIPGLSYRIYASFGGGPFEMRRETTENYFLDFVPENGKNSTVTYRVVTVLQDTESEATEATAQIRDFSDDELLDMVQRYTFRYFWEGAHQATGMALERSNGSGVTAASGATGIGLMAMIVAHEREYRPKEEVKNRILMVLDFLKNCDRHHGAWSHWYNANTLRTQPFSSDDDGGDLVETSYVAQALVALKNYFSGTDEKSVQIREQADQLWKEIDWDWYRNGGQNVLFWHWSPNFNFQKNMKVTGWNECLVTYLMAASSPTHPIPKEVYDQGWAGNGNIVNPRTFYNHLINLSPNYGGPLFWIHYSHLGINPHNLKDQYADYWLEHVNTAKIHHAYAIDNPFNFENYSDKNWGLTASDSPGGYTAHQPNTNDNGTISPTAALASMPYTPEESMQALKYFYRERGLELFGKYGPYDAFNDQVDWVQKSYIGIDQGPIVVMIENHRTGLLWNSVMADDDVQAGLDKLGFQYEIVTSSNDLKKPQKLSFYPNPGSGKVYLNLSDFSQNAPVILKCFSLDGRLVRIENLTRKSSEAIFDCSDLTNGIYLLQLTNGKDMFQGKLIVQQ